MIDEKMKMLRQFEDAHAMLTDVLEHMLPRRDAQKQAVARNILKHYGSIATALEAHPSDLVREGLSRSSALLLGTVPQLARYVQVESVLSDNPRINTLTTCKRLFTAQCIGLRHERLYLLCLGQKGNVIELRKIMDGTTYETLFPVQMIITQAMQCEARYLVLCHNHPSGTQQASTSDVTSTRKLIDTCARLNLVLLDHLIVASGSAISMRETAMDDEDFLLQAPGDRRLIDWLET